MTSNTKGKYRGIFLLNIFTQFNYLCIYSNFSENNNCELHFIKQKSETWFDVRNSVHVTGNTSNTAQCLEKKFSLHIIYDKIYHVVKTNVAQNMQYGSENEIKATVNLVSKVLSVGIFFS